MCELHLEAPSGHRLRWADALVVEAPEFALPLRARVTASLPEEGAARVTLLVPLFARAENTGELRVQGRAVSCPSADEATCVSLRREVTAPVAVLREGRAPEGKLAQIARP